MTTNNAVNVPLAGNTGTGNFVGANTPTLITPNLGVATATSLQCPTFLDANGNNSLSLFAYTSAVNYFQLVNSATAVGLAINAVGTDTNISMSVNMKGNGAFAVQNTTAANILLFQPSLTTVVPTIQVAGTDSNISLGFISKAGGFFTFQSSTLANYINLVPNATGNAPIFDASGSDAAVSMVLRTKGAGQFNFQSTTLANLLVIVPGGTGNNSAISAGGSDSNVGITIQAKAAGQHVLQTTNATPLLIQSGTAAQHLAYFAFTNAATTQTITFPDGNYTVTNSNNVYAISFIMSRGLY